MPKYLGYFEAVLANRQDGASYLAGQAATYADLSLFQLVEGLAYAYSKSHRSPGAAHTAVDGLARGHCQPPAHRRLPAVAAPPAVQ